MIVTITINDYAWPGIAGFIVLITICTIMIKWVWSWTKV